MRDCRVMADLRILPPSPPLRGRGVGGEGEEERPLTPDPSPRSTGARGGMLSALRLKLRRVEDGPEDVLERLGAAVGLLAVGLLDVGEAAVLLAVGRLARQRPQV